MDFRFAVSRGNFGFIGNYRASPTLAQCERNFKPIALLLHMRGIGLGQRTMQSVFRAVIVHPLPNLALSAFRACDVDGAAMAVTAGTAAAPVQRVAGTCFVARSEPLTIIVAESAQHGPLQPSSIHGSSSMIKLLAEFGIHAADHIIPQGEPYVLGSCRIFPGEITGPIFLNGHTLIN